MQPTSKKYITTVGGRPFTFETGKLAGQAGGSVTVQFGESVVFAAATMGKEPREGQDFFPLTVEYEEMIGPYDLSASMGIPGQVADPRVKEAIEKVRLACQKTGMPLGIFTASVPFARECAKNGFTLIAVSTDTLMVVDASRKLLQELNA